MLRCAYLLKLYFRYFADVKIDYFDDFTLDEVLKKSRVRNEWDEKHSAYKLTKGIFLGLKVFETN